jgi:hypothetical protein
MEELNYDKYIQSKLGKYFPPVWLRDKKEDKLQ